MKKIVLGLAAFAVGLAVIPLFAAFEAHVVNVTATIENALDVPLEHTGIDFGTVFPQEQLNHPLDISLSGSFQSTDRVDDVNYVIRQKPKCELIPNGSGDLPRFGRVVEDENGNFVCEDSAHYAMLPLLCPYLSKHADNAPDNDESIPSFHGPITNWTLADTLATQVHGHLAKSEQDLSDNWNIDLKVPCFGGNCAQDWADYVRNINPNADPEAYIQPLSNEHKLFGCDLWVEVGGISVPGVFGCAEKLDLMLVLDRSGSISSSELATLKNAAHAFVNALDPSPDGIHMGQTSFSTTGSLDLHVGGDRDAANAAIDAIVAGGTTHLQDGIELAKAELDNPGDGHDRLDGESKDYFVIITDGAPNQCNGSGCDPRLAAKAAADAAKAAGVEIFVVGVGTTPDTAAYLRDNIASGADHYFDAGDFDDLQNILVGLAQCDGNNP